MNTMLGWGKKAVFLIFVMIAISACSPIPAKKPDSSPSSVIPIMTTAISSQNITPPGTETPFVALLATPSSSATKDTIPTVRSTLSPTTSPSIEPTTVWGDPAGLYATITISADQSIVVYRLHDQSFTTFSIQPGKVVSVLEVQRIIDACHLLTSVKIQQDGLRFSLEIYNQYGALIQDVFHLDNKDPDTFVKFLPVWSLSKRYISYVVYSGQQFYDFAQYQDVEVVQANQQEKAIRLTERGGAWKEGGAWSPKGDQIAYTDYDEQGILQVYLSDLTKNTRRGLTHFTNTNHKPGPIYWSPTGGEIAVFMGETQDSFNEAWVIAVPAGTVSAIPKPVGVTGFGGTLWWSETGDKILLTGGGGDPDSAGLYWLDSKTFHVLHSLTDGRVKSLNENTNSISQPFSLAADLSVIGFYNWRREFFTYRVFDQKVEPIQGLDAKGWEFIWDIKAFPKDVLACTKK
jgi:hypothetical protein